MLCGVFVSAFFSQSSESLFPRTAAPQAPVGAPHRVQQQTTAVRTQAGREGAYKHENVKIQLSKRPPAHRAKGDLTLIPVENTGLGLQLHVLDLGQHQRAGS